MQQHKKNRKEGRKRTETYRQWNMDAETQEEQKRR